MLGNESKVRKPIEVTAWYYQIMFKILGVMEIKKSQDTKEMCQNSLAMSWEGKYWNIL